MNKKKNILKRFSALFVSISLLSLFFFGLKPKKEKTIQASAQESQYIFTTGKYYYTNQTYVPSTNFYSNPPIALSTFMTSFQFAFDMTSTSSALFKVYVTTFMPPPSPSSEVVYTIRMNESALAGDIGLASGFTSPRYIGYRCSGGSIMPSVDSLPTGFNVSYMTDSEINSVKGGMYLSNVPNLHMIRFNFFIDNVDLDLYVPTSSNNTTVPSWITSINQNIYFDSSFDNSFLVNQAYNNGYNEGLFVGNSSPVVGSASYNLGFEEGSRVGSNLYTLISGIFDAPVNLVKQSLQFDILGVNVSELVFGLLTLCIVIFVLKRLITNLI